jgi:hypothetical protein
MMCRRWQLPYLGDRNYVHGTTIVDRILSEFTPGFPLDVRFQSPILGEVEVRSASSAKPNVAVSFEQHGQRALYGLFDAGQGSSNDRRSFDEQAIAARVTLSEKSASSPHDSDASLIARIVVMKKALMAGIFPDARGKWWFAELWLEAWPTAVTAVEVKFDRNIGTKLVRSTVRANGDPIGKISFSLREDWNP